MTILIITADLECCKCKAKISKALDCLTEEYGIEKVEYETKKNTVVVHGKFDAEKLCCRIRCKAGKCIKDCKPKPEDKPKPLVVCCKPKPDECCKCKSEVCCKPKPDECCKCKLELCCKPKPDECCCKPKPKPEPEEKSKPPPKPEYKLVPYPMPYPMACPSWPWQCPPQQQCQSCTPPPPPPPPSCKCSQHHSSPCGCVGMSPSVWPPQPVAWAPPPPQWGPYELVTPPESACSVM